MSGQIAGTANLATIMRDISEALSLDRNDKIQDAYRKYLECVLRITTKLLKTLHSDGGHLVVSREVTKFVKLGQQCMDRVGSLVSERVDNSADGKSSPGNVQDRGMVLNLQSPRSEFISGGFATPGNSAYRITSPGSMVSPREDQKKDFSSLPSTDMARSSRRKKLSPLETAVLQNKQLLKAFKARQAKTGTSTATATLSLTLQRKMAENIAIGQAQEKALALRMKQRQQRLEEQAAKRFHTPIGLSAEEQEQRQIYRRVLEFEQEEISMYDWRKRLEEKPQDVVTISQLIKNVLSYKDHPLTQELEKYQTKILMKLQPLVEDKMDQVNQIRVPLAGDLLKSIQQYQSSFNQSETEGRDKSNRLSVSSQSTNQSYQSLDKTDTDYQDEGTMRSCETEESDSSVEQDSSLDSSLNKDETRKDEVEVIVDESDRTDEMERTDTKINDSDTQSGFEETVSDEEEDDRDNQSVNVEGNMEDVTEDLKHNLQKAMIKGQALRTSLESENQTIKSIIRRVSQDYETYNAENMDDLFDDDDEEMVNIDDQTGSCSGSMKYSTSAEEKQVESGTPVKEDGKKVPADQESTEEMKTTGQDDDTKEQPSPNYAALEKRLKQLRNEAYHRHLSGISEDIISRIERLQVLFVIVYEQLDSAEGRDQCNLILEEEFFRPLWHYILALFRLSNEPKEIAIAYVMTRHLSSSRPQDFGVREKLCLEPATSDSSDYAYKAAVDELRQITEYPAMLSKLDCLVHTSRQVVKCVEQYYGKDSQPPSIGADDLLPVLCYIVASCRLPQIVSECQAMGRFIHEGYMFGEEGYCLTSFQTAINYLVSLGMKAES